MALDTAGAWDSGAWEAAEPYLNAATTSAAQELMPQECPESCIGSLLTLLLQQVRPCVPKHHCRPYIFAEKAGDVGLLHLCEVNLRHDRKAGMPNQSACITLREQATCIAEWSAKS